MAKLEITVKWRLTAWFYVFKAFAWLNIIDGGIIEYFFNKPAAYMYVNGKHNQTFYFKDFL